MYEVPTIPISGTKNFIGLLGSALDHDHLSFMIAERIPFMKHILLCCCFVFACLGTGSESMYRIELPLNEHWLFQVVDSEQANVPATSWELVNLPHTWNATDGSQLEKDYRKGYGYYQHSFFAPQTWQGRSVFITIGAANAKAVVRLNGHIIGTHITGFTAFRCDLTPHLKFGVNNDVQIEVDNRISQAYPPITSDYTFFGGLYLTVSLTVTDTVHVSLMHHGASGVYLEQKEVSRAMATVHVHV
jgi:beta-galactosidase